MIKRFFAPFRAKVAQAEQQGFGVFFLELYFYVLILIWAAYNIFTIVDTLTSYAQVHAVPWYNAFNSLDSTFILSMVLLSSICLIWQYIELRHFSSRFFIALWLLFIFRGMLYISFYYENGWFFEYLKFLVPYGLTIAYFYRRKCLFGTKNAA